MKRCRNFTKKSSLLQANCECMPILRQAAHSTKKRRCFNRRGCRRMQGIRFGNNPSSMDGPRPIERTKILALDKPFRMAMLFPTAAAAGSQKHSPFNPVATWTRSLQSIRTRCCVTHKAAERNAMAIIRWDPLGNISSLQDRINKLFDDSFPRQKHADEALPPCTWVPDVDIYENEDGYYIAADLPGVRKEDVVVEVRNNILTISGERYADPAVKAANYYRQERVCGKFFRTFTLHAMIPPDAIKARFKHGVLVVEIPKPEADHARQISVDSA
jgi:HSP20 family protein